MMVLHDPSVQFICWQEMKGRAPHQTSSSDAVIRHIKSHTHTSLSTIVFCLTLITSCLESGIMGYRRGVNYEMEADVDHLKIVHQQD